MVGWLINFAHPHGAFFLQGFLGGKAEYASHQAVVATHGWRAAVKNAIPVPPFAVGRMPVTPVVRGSPVAFVRVPLAGVGYRQNGERLSHPPICRSPLLQFLRRGMPPSMSSVMLAGFSLCTPLAHVQNLCATKRGRTRILADGHSPPYLLSAL